MASYINVSGIRLFFRCLLFLRPQVYRSSEHFLQVLHSLSDRLTDMPLPSYDPSGGDDHPFDVCQVRCDTRLLFVGIYYCTFSF